MARSLRLAGRRSTRRARRTRFASIAAVATVLLVLTVVFQTQGSTSPIWRLLWALASITITVSLLVMLIAEVVRQLRTERLLTRADEALQRVSRLVGDEDENRSFGVLLDDLVSSVAAALDAAWVELRLDDGSEHGIRVTCGARPAEQEHRRKHARRSSVADQRAHLRAATHRFARAGLGRTSIQRQRPTSPAAAGRAGRDPDRAGSDGRHRAALAPGGRTGPGPGERPRPGLGAARPGPRPSRRRRSPSSATSSYPSSPTCSPSIWCGRADSSSGSSMIAPRPGGRASTRRAAAPSSPNVARHPAPGDGSWHLGAGVHRREPQHHAPQRRSRRVAARHRHAVVGRGADLGAGPRDGDDDAGHRGQPPRLRPSDQVTIDDLVARSSIAFERGLLYEEARQAARDASAPGRPSWPAWSRPRSRSPAPSRPPLCSTRSSSRRHSSSMHHTLTPSWPATSTRRPSTVRSPSDPSTSRRRWSITLVRRWAA